MKMRLTVGLLAATVLALPCSTVYGQTTGTSHPEDLKDDVNAEQAAPVYAVQGSQHYVKPSPAVPATMPASTASAADTAGPVNGYGDHYQALTQRPVPATDSNGIVTDVPIGPHELAIGTRLKAYLQTPISTKTTAAGSRFKAAIQSDMMRDGQVLIPAGTVIEGRISQIHGGRRITGTAAIRMQPDTLRFPDGTRYKLVAEVVDVDHFRDSHVNREGTIVENSNAKNALVIGGFTTGTAVIAGAMIGGGVGAVVGLGVGVGAGTVLWLRQDRQEHLPQGTEIVFSMNDSLDLQPGY